MKRNLLLSVAATALLAAVARLTAAEVEPGFTLLCDGTTFNGWKASIDHTNTWKIEDGAFVTRGETRWSFHQHSELAVETLSREA